MPFMGIKEGRELIMLLLAPGVPTKSSKYSSTWSDMRIFLLTQDLVPTRQVPYHQVTSLAHRFLIVVAGQL